MQLNTMLMMMMLMMMMMMMMMMILMMMRTMSTGIYNDYYFTWSILTLQYTAIG